MKQLRPRWSGPLDCPPGQALCGLRKLAGPTREDHLEGDARWAPDHANRERSRGRVGVARRQRAFGAGRGQDGAHARVGHCDVVVWPGEESQIAVGEPGLRAGSHDRGRVIRNLAVMLADGGDCLADLRAVSDQAALFEWTASPSTAVRVIDRIATTPGLLDGLRDAPACARARVWELGGAPQRLTIDLDATLITAHSEKDRAAGTFKGGYGFAPMLADGDQTGEALAGELRPGNAAANNAADQIAVAEQAVAQIPVGHIETIELVLRVDSAGASHELLDWCRAGQIEYSVGYDLTETVRAAILQIPAEDWVCSLDQAGHARPNGEVCEITQHLDLTNWPDGTRVIIRRERAHPGAQLSFTDHDGHRFQRSSPTKPDRSPSLSEITADARVPRTTSATTKSRPARPTVVPARTRGAFTCRVPRGRRPAVGRRDDDH